MSKKDNIAPNKKKSKNPSEELDLNQDEKLENGSQSNNHKKIAEERLRAVLKDIENPNTVKIGGKEFLPETLAGGASAITDIGFGIAGLFKDDDIGANAYESTYETSKALPGMRDKALQMATNPDDYAARIRAKNMYNENVQSAINRSGGSRAFVQSNVSAAGDVYNLANLGIDKEMGERKERALSLAANIENAVIQDKLNKLKDLQYSNDDKYKKLLGEITLDKENRAGAISLLKGGLNSLGQGLNYESQWGKGGVMRNSMASRALMELSRIGKN